MELHRGNIRELQIKMNLYVSSMAKAHEQLTPENVVRCINDGGCEDLGVIFNLKQMNINNYLDVLNCVGVTTIDTTNVTMPVNKVDLINLQNEVTRSKKAESLARSLLEKKTRDANIIEEKMEEEIRVEKDAHRELSQKIDFLINKIEAMDKDMQILKVSNSVLTEDNESLKNRFDEMKADNDILNNRVNELETTNDRLTKETSDLKGRVIALETALFAMK